MSSSNRRGSRLKRLLDLFIILVTGYFIMAKADRRRPEVATDRFATIRQESRLFRGYGGR